MVKTQNTEFDTLMKKIQSTAENISELTLKGDFEGAKESFLELKSLMKQEVYLEQISHGKGGAIDIEVKKYGSMLLRHTNLSKGLGTVSKQLLEVLN
ncbi:hypothetical protein RyT2_26560 [Pseudolactococcus yaeyamensis]